MTAKEMKIKTLSLIEEYYPDNTLLADDQDIIYKINGVINSVLMDIFRYKKAPAKYETTITSDEPTILLKDIPNFYQLNSIDGVEYDICGDYEIKFDFEEDEESKDVVIYYYKLPALMDLTFEATDTKTADEVSAEYDKEFSFDIALDLQEIMPYGIAADLLKMDMISGYGRYFYERYQELKSLIDSRTSTGSIYINGGVDI